MTNPMPCQRCGQPHPRCSAHRRDGSPCTMWPMRGQRVCKMHGGKKPAAKANAERREAEAEAARLLQLHNPNAEPVTDAMGALRRLAGVLQQAFDVAGARVNDLSSVASVDAKGTETLKAQVQLWQALLGHLRPVLVDIERLSTEERVVRLAEERAQAEVDAWGRLFEPWVGYVLGRLGVDVVAASGVLVEMWEGLARRALPPGSSEVA